MAREGRAGAFAALVARQREAGDQLAGGGIEGLVGADLDGEIASLRLTILKALREIDDPFNRALAVAKLAEAVARVQTARARLAPEGSSDLSRVLRGVLAEMGLDG